jgi:hypothetical protein
MKLGSRPKEVRKRAGLSLIAAAVGAGVSETTTRVYEANPEAVSIESRTRLDAFYESLRAARSRSEVA